MLGHQGALDVVLLVAGVITIAGGALLALRAVRNAVTAFLAAWFILFGLSQVSAALRWYDMVPGLGALSNNLEFAALICFGIAYPSTTLTTRQKWFLLWAFIPAVPLALLDDGWLLWDFGPANLLSEVYGRLALQAVPLLFAWKWLRETGEHIRGQITWVLVPMLFWVVHDGLRRIVIYTLIEEPTAGALAWKVAVVYAFVALDALLIAATAGFGIWAFARSRKQTGGIAASSRHVVTAILAIFLVSPLQFTLPPPGRDVLHLTVDSLAFLALFYGVARYRILDMDLRLRWGVRQGTLAGFFVAAFFVATEAAQQFLGETLGSSYVGIAAAGALVFAIAPLQKFAERVSVKAVPVQGGTDAYLAYRRLQIYRAALEGALKDDQIRPWEEESLRALRRELGVTDEEHALLERDLRGAREAPTASSA